MSKLLLGSVAEHIFRHAGCLVLTVGPGSLQDSPVGSGRAIHHCQRCHADAGKRSG
ncbi:MAG TPA: universal stress protein [Terriglobales bacterium]|nr:universal stress protein [Terriglobales bacterium]HXY52244.1 universal stress protein [Terriglobales bacterium]